MSKQKTGLSNNCVVPSYRQLFLNENLILIASSQRLAAGNWQFFYGKTLESFTLTKNL